MTTNAAEAPDQPRDTGSASMASSASTAPANAQCTCAHLQVNHWANAFFCRVCDCALYSAKPVTS